MYRLEGVFHGDAQLVAQPDQEVQVGVLLGEGARDEGAGREGEGRVGGEHLRHLDQLGVEVVEQGVGGQRVGGGALGGGGGARGLLGLDGARLGGGALALGLGLVVGLALQQAARAQEGVEVVLDAVVGPGGQRCRVGAYLPGISLAISAQRGPSELKRLQILASSSGVKGALLTAG